MAKKVTPSFDDIINPKATPEPEAPKKKQQYKPVSVGLTAEELTRLMAIAAELGQPRHAVLKYAVIDFIKRYEAGERPEMVRVLNTNLE